MLFGIKIYLPTTVSFLYLNLINTKMLTLRTLCIAGKVELVSCWKGIWWKTVHTCKHRSKYVSLLPRWIFGNVFVMYVCVPSSVHTWWGHCMLRFWRGDGHFTSCRTKYCVCWFLSFQKIEHTHSISTVGDRTKIWKIRGRFSSCLFFLSVV